MAYAMPPEGELSRRDKRGHPGVLPKGEAREVTKHAAGRPYYAFYAPRGTEGYARKRKTTRFRGWN